MSHSFEALVALRNAFPLRKSLSVLAVSVSPPPPLFLISSLSHFAVLQASFQLMKVMVTPLIFHLFANLSRSLFSLFPSLMKNAQPVKHRATPAMVILVRNFFIFILTAFSSVAQPFHAFQHVSMDLLRQAAMSFFMLPICFSFNLCTSPSRASILSSLSAISAFMLLNLLSIFLLLRSAFPAFLWAASISGCWESTISLIAV
mmetsp:Transcript_11400/g.23324  ORF Transcript_11400/g.23324 Transcript_11400/m.23324 type:complete len:203 (+) Transcript_11400:359-967(+)